MYYRTNFNYEHQLLNGRFEFPLAFNTQNWNYEFEYLFFFIQKDEILNTPIVYSADYIEYLKIKFNLDPKFENAPQKNYQYWWGDSTNFELELKLNCKKYFWKLCQRLKVPYPVSVDKISDLPKLDEKVIIRKNLGMSGKGSKVLKKEEIRKIEKNQIVSNYIKKEKDFGVIFENNEFFYYENVIDQFNQYKGSLFFPKKITNSDLLMNNIFNSLSDPIKELMKLTNKRLQFDGFICPNGKFYFNEINFRQTMGNIAKEISHKFFPTNYCILKVYSYSEYLKIPRDIENQILITPTDGNKTYLFGLVLKITNSFEK